MSVVSQLGVWPRPIPKNNVRLLRKNFIENCSIASFALES